MRRVVALTIMLLLALAPLAHAGTAQIGERYTDNRYSPSDPALFFTAAPGERNQIVVIRDAAAGSDVAVLRDLGAGVIAGPGCTAIDAHTVSCRAGATVVNAGDGDDAVTVPSNGPASFNTDVYGGEGADTLTGSGNLHGGPGRDVLTGSPYSDTLLGGTGDDLLHGGAGDDRLIGDGDGVAKASPDPGGGDDLIDGGDGSDTVLYIGRRAGVRVDLEAATMNAAAGERDRFEDIENITGGLGPDVLIGDGRRNRIEGHPGDDDLRGGGGNDTLGGGAGTDTLRGGDGDDVLDTRDRRDALFGGDGDDLLAASNDAARPARRFRCGRGEDTVKGDPRGQRLDGCERLDLFGGVKKISVRPQHRARGALRFAWSCDGSSISCDMVLTLRLRSRPLARRSVSLPDRAHRAFLVHPRRPTRRGDVLEIAVSGTLNYDTGGRPRYAASWRVTL